MTERLAAYFNSEDQAQRAVPQLRAFGAREITVERLEGEDNGVLPFLTGYNSSTAGTVPSTGTLPSAAGISLASRDFGVNEEEVDAGQGKKGKRYLLECEVTSEQAPQALAILTEHGAILEG